MAQRRALIVGGGVAGLSAAWWLSQVGWRPLVVERSLDLRRDGYMIGLSGPGYEAIRAMGLVDRLRARARDIDENVYFDRRGREIVRLRYKDFMQGVEWLTLLRHDLVDELHDLAAPAAEIRFGTTVERFAECDDTITARLSDGSDVEADLLIGADGVHSQIRAQVFGSESDFSRPLGYRVAAFEAEDEYGLGADFRSYAEPGRLAEFYALPEKRLATLYIWRSDTTEFVPVEERKNALLAAFAGTNPDALRWVEALPEQAPVFFDSMAMIEMEAWSRGHVLLLGDSAHCLTLVAGQGAGMAMRSAQVLAEELAAHDIATALSRHAARLRPTIDQLQARSRKMAAWYIPDAAWKFAMRNKILRVLPRRLLGRYFRRTVRDEIDAATRALDAGEANRGA